MLKNYFFVLLISLVSFVNAQQNILSPEAEISVLTIGPGTSLNDSFGHNAFRIKDIVKGTDLVFNYGVYDFDTPNFYTKFAQGKLNYLIGLNYFEDFFESYIAQNRTIKEQVLNLSSEEKQALFNYLLNNVKPENRAYLYDFFYDNCATKIRDVLQEVLNNRINFHEPENFETQTFRKLIHGNLNRNSWGCFGIDLALGSVIDTKATPYQHMFLPKYIYSFFDNATLIDSNEKLVKQSNVLYQKTETNVTNNFLTSPLAILGLLGILIVFITFQDYKKNRRSVWLDVALFTITGIIGVLILLLWFATDHQGTHQNYNLLWAFALNILVIGQVLKVKASPWFVKYLKLLLIMLCLLTLHWIIGVQIFAICLIPFLVALAVRYVFLIKHFSKAR